MKDFFAHWMTQNFLVIAGIALVAWILWSGAHHERWQRAWIRLRADRGGMIALWVVGIYLFIGAMELVHLPNGKGGHQSILDVVFANHVALEKTYSSPLSDTVLASASGEKLKGTHLLGTDTLGKDVLVETLKGCSTALVLGGLTSIIYIPLGTLMGILAGYFRRWVDDVVQYIYTTVASIPSILLLISLMMVLGKGLFQMSIAIAFTSWVGLCRLIRGETMRQSERSYVAAAKSLGQTSGAIMSRHILPNVMHLVLINFVLGFSGVILMEAVLSYLGVGSPVGTASWGNMIDGGRSELSRDPLIWWNLTSATIALFGLVLSLNVLGDSLRRAFDPKRG